MKIGQVDDVVAIDDLVHRRPHARVGGGAMTGCPLLDSEYAARQNGKRLPCERLAVENAKLQELVRDIVLLAPNRGADILRVEWSTSDGSWLSIKDRMRKLGVEIQG